MINYYTRNIKINEIKVNDYIDISGTICKVLSIHNNDDIYKITGIDDTSSIYKCLYDINKPFFRNKKFTKYVFIYKYEIWRIQDFDDNGIEFLKKEKIAGDFINYDNAEIYAKKYINLILDEDIAPHLDEIIIMKSTDYIDYEINKLFAKLS